MLITSKSEILCMLLPVFLCVAGRSTMYLLHGTENLQILHVKDVTIVYNVKNFHGSLTTVVRAQNDTTKTANITDTIFDRTLV